MEFIARILIQNVTNLVFEDALEIDWTSSLYKLIQTIAFSSSYIDGEYENK